MKGDGIEKFKRTISGKFSNKEQAHKSPKDFAHINIYIRPLPDKLFNCTSFYSEQSFNYDPWNPYRQSVQKLYKQGVNYILEGYSIKDSQRIAGGGFNQDLLKDIRLEKLLKRKGCNMIFKENKEGHYIGSIEDGKNCIIKRLGKITYLVSSVELYDDTWISLDEGYDIKSCKKIWGSENGKLKFKRVQNFL